MTGKTSLKALIEQRNNQHAPAQPIPVTEADAVAAKPKKRLPVLQRHADAGVVGQQATNTALQPWKDAANAHGSHTGFVVALPQQAPGNVPLQAQLLPQQQQQQQRRRRPVQQASLLLQYRQLHATSTPPLTTTASTAATTAEPVTTAAASQGTKLSQPGWDRRFRALKALDALGPNPQQDSQLAASPVKQQQQQGQADAAVTTKDWLRRVDGLSAPVANATNRTASNNRATARQLKQQQRQQWDKALADHATDELWDMTQTNKQQQQQRKGQRQQAEAAPALLSAGTHKGSYDSGIEGGALANEAGSSQRKRHRAATVGVAGTGAPPGASGVVVDNRFNLSAMPEPLLAAVPGQGPAEPLMLEDDKTGLHLQVPGTINKHLRSYQREGVKFLFKLYAAGHGGVLSDDMGLGKTVQAIAFISALLGKTGTITDQMPCRNPANAGTASVGWPLLVVAPTSVLDNWMREFGMWGWFKVDKYHGARRGLVARQVDQGLLEVVLTSYNTLRANAEDILAMNPYAVVFDEVHMLKNPGSQTYEAAKELKTSYKYGLSGTLMPNEHGELWAVLDLLSPCCLGDYDSFAEYYSKPIKRGQSATAKDWEMTKAASRLEKLQQALSEVYLRRTKAIIANQLPRKTDCIMFCTLKPLQYRAYDRTLASPDLQALIRSKEPCDCGSGEGRGSCCHGSVPAEEGGVMWPHYHMCTCSNPECTRHRPEGCQEYYASMGRTKTRIRCPNCLMLPAIVLLQKISNHLDLIRPDAKLAQQDERQFAYEIKLAGMVLGADAEEVGGLMANSGGWLQRSDDTYCGKMAALRNLFAAWSADRGANNKVLLFSHSARCLDLLQDFVTRHGYDFVRLDGSTPQKERQQLVDDFNTRSSSFIFLMTTLAGGVGLNLTAANKVVVFDPSWNPSNDLQAQDRAYRLGQTRDVEVYRLLGTGTLEEVVYRRQIYKQQQANMVLEGVQEARYWEGVQGDPEKKGELWGLGNLLRFSGHTVETQDILRGYAQDSKDRHRLEMQLQQRVKEEQLEDEQQQQQHIDTEVQPAAAAIPATAGHSKASKNKKQFEIVKMDALVPVDKGIQEEGGTLIAGFLGDAAFAEDAAEAALEIIGLSPAKAKQHRKQQQQQQEAPEADAQVDDQQEQASPHCRRKNLRSIKGETADSAGAAEAQGQEFVAVYGNDSGGEFQQYDCKSLKQQQGGLEQQQQQHAPRGWPRPADKAKRRHARVAKSFRRHQQLLDDSKGDTDLGPAGSDVEMQPITAGCGGDGDSGGSDSSMSGGSPGSQEGAAGGAAANSLAANTLALDPLVLALQQDGTVMHMHRHDKLLRRGGAKQQPSKNSQQHRQSAAAAGRKGIKTLLLQAGSKQQQKQHAQPAAAVKFVAAKRNIAAPAGSVMPEASLLDGAWTTAEHGGQAMASLAVWKGVNVVDLAEQLLGASEVERRQLMQEYAAQLAH